MQSCLGLCYVATRSLQTSLLALFCNSSHNGGAESVILGVAFQNSFCKAKRWQYDGLSLGHILRLQYLFAIFRRMF